MSPAADTEAAGPGPLELGQRCLKEGQLEAAVTHLEEALALPGGESVDAHLLLAEALWQASGGAGTERALPHYEAAAALAQKAGDSSKEGMVALGHGFALAQLGRHAAARERLLQAQALAEADGNPDAVRFVERLLEQVGAPPATGPEAVRETWRQFAEALAQGKPAVLFMRGTLASPADAESLRAAAALRAAGCSRLEVVDVCTPGADVPDGLQGLSGSPHLAFPQLFVAGLALEGWLELAAGDLRERLAAAGAELGEPGTEPCHGGAAFAEGLEPWETALVDLVSKHGAGDWPAKAAGLAERGFGGEGPALDAAALEAAWQRLAPRVREKLEKQEEMPCGHSCSTCPTRHDCQLHDAVAGVKDIEDLGG